MVGSYKADPKMISNYLLDFCKRHDLRMSQISKKIGRIKHNSVNPVLSGEDNYSLFTIMENDETSIYFVGDPKVLLNTSRHMKTQSMVNRIMSEMADRFG